MERNLKLFDRKNIIEIKKDIFQKFLKMGKYI